MARRPDISEFDTPLTQAEVAEMRKHLAAIDPFRVIRFYQQAHERCRLHGGMLPGAKAVQELVAAWKVLRDRKKAGPPSRS